jgi:hypothetical protein
MGQEKSYNKVAEKKELENKNGTAVYELFGNRI